MIAVEEKKIKDMTGEELKTLIRDTILELLDPDYGLELREDIEQELKKSLKSKKRIPAADIAEKLGFEW